MGRKSRSAHDQTLRKVLNRIRANGLKLNKSKCVFSVPELTFLGHVISKDGIKVDPKKVEAVSNMALPTNKVELQRFLVMINYLGKFIPNLSEVTYPLRILLEKDNEFKIQQPQIDTINKLKSAITSAPIFQFFNPNASTRLRTDASSEGPRCNDRATN